MRGGNLLSLALCLALFASSSYQASHISRRVKRQARSNLQVKRPSSDTSVQSSRQGYQQSNRQASRGSGRTNLQTCSITPAVEDPRTPSHENEGITINCAADGHVDVCVIKHTKPMYVGQCTGNNQVCTNGEQTKCIATVDDNGMTCTEDSRIQFIMGNNGCGIKISRADPDDVGKWEFMVSDYSASTNPSGNSKTVTIYTFNRTIVDFTDDREQKITRNLEVWYNYDENEKEYRAGSNGYENIRLNCNGRGGRPEPTITWMINNNDRLAFGEDLTGEADRIFNPKEQYTHTYDPEGYIRDKSSELDFTINQEFMSYIGNNYGIDVNPEGEQFSFELTCIVDQGDYGTEELSMMINVRRVYWRNGFNGWEIFGISIGAILGFAILVALLVVCCCAAIKGWWCFENPDRRYEDANNQKRRPRTQVDVYSDDSHIIKAKGDYAPSAPLGRTHTTLVGQVKGDPAPHPNRESAPVQLLDKSQLKPVNVDSGLDSTPSSPSLAVHSSLTTSNTLRTSSTSSNGSSYIKNPKRRPKSQHISATAAAIDNLPPKAPAKKNRHSYHQQQNVTSTSEQSYDSYNQQQFGSNHNLSATSNSGFSTSNQNLANGKKFGSNPNLGTAQYFGSMHELPDRQVVPDEYPDGQSYNDRVTYADLDHKSFMVPKNQVLPKLDKLNYAELQVSRSKIV